MTQSMAGRELPASGASLTTRAMHWAYGVQWGPVFGLAIGSARELRPWHAQLLGVLVWLASYVLLTAAFWQTCRS